jgi:hypothetical protein
MRFVRKPENQLQATTLVALFCGGLLIRVDDDNRVKARWPRPDVEFGHRLCRAYETYLLLHEDARLSFEWAWNLLHSISYNDELRLASCGDCRTRYVQDAYGLDNAICPSCQIEARTGS